MMACLHYQLRVWCAPVCLAIGLHGRFCAICTACIYGLPVQVAFYFTLELCLQVPVCVGLCTFVVCNAILICVFYCVQ